MSNIKQDIQCTDCLRCFKTKYGYERHINAKTKCVNNINCPYCGKHFYNIPSKLNHIKSNCWVLNLIDGKINIIEKFTCQYCGTKHWTIIDQKNHMNNCEVFEYLKHKRNRLLNDLIDKYESLKSKSDNSSLIESLSNGNDILVQLGKKKEELITCPFCNREFLVIKERNEHVLRCTNREIITDYKFNKNVKLHMLDVSDQKYEQLIQIIKEKCCPHCYIMFENGNGIDIKIHVLNCVRDRTCNKCDYTLTTRQGLMDHMRVCKVIKSDKKDGHKTSNNGSAAEIEQKRNNKRKRELDNKEETRDNKHMRIIETNTLETINPAHAICLLCHKYFETYSVDNIINHLSLCILNRTCVFCNMIFKNINDKINHIELIHKKQECHKNIFNMFVENYNLNLRNKCPVCFKTFKKNTVDYILEHIYHCVMDRTCNYCNIIFRNIYDKTNHYELVHIQSNYYHNVFDFNHYYENNHDNGNERNIETNNIPDIEENKNDNNEYDIFDIDFNK